MPASRYSRSYTSGCASHRRLLGILLERPALHGCYSNAAAAVQYAVHQMHLHRALRHDRAGFTSSSACAGCLCQNTCSVLAAWMAAAAATAAPDLNIAAARYRVRHRLRRLRRAVRNVPAAAATAPAPLPSPAATRYLWDITSSERAGRRVHALQQWPVRHRWQRHGRGTTSDAPSPRVTP